WDGTPLPGGAYELVAFQDFYPASDQSVPPAEPTLVPIDPTLVPIDPTLAPVDPTTAPESPITVDGDAGTAASTDGGATAGDTGTVDPAADAPAERAVSNTVTFVVAGDVPDDPFGAYLSPAVPAVVYPDDYLTPAAARDEYATRVTSGKWDMAAGTQRVVKSGDSTTMDDQNAWLDSYYGCSADGTTTPSFPAASADWPLLKVEANLPGSVGVSYGWVVNGNPEVDVSVTNISGHTLPGFWGQPNTTLYLVKDGKVAATSYLAPIDPNAYTRSQATDGLLSPDGTLGGTYLWRDVSGCWIGDAQTTIASGTYTVLMEQDIYLDNGNAGNGGPVVYFEDKAAVDGAATGAGSDASENSGVVGGSVTAPRVATDAPSLVAPAPAPEAGTYDWLSLQVWTSLGKVTIK
ncbi:MAG: hypothetical protein HGA51_10370, partial [Demequinaceae bacterium]|nr:hypothetical protein [Demequinaceae bacterium]